jgi:hypothetical protein
MSRGCGQGCRDGTGRTRLIVLTLARRYEKAEAHLHYSRASGWMLALPSPVVFFAQYFFTQAS